MIGVGCLGLDDLGEQRLEWPLLAHDRDAEPFETDIDGLAAPFEQAVGERQKRRSGRNDTVTDS